MKLKQKTNRKLHPQKTLKPICMNDFVKYFFISLCVCTILSCEKKNVDTNESANVRLNKYVENTMKDYYYWVKEIQDRKPDNALSPENFLAEMKYMPEDKWTYWEKDPEVETKSAEPDVYETGMGYRVLFFENRSEYIGIVVYVYPNTPAAEAGLKRGDLIISNNGKTFTETSRMEILTASEINIETGEFIDAHTIGTREEKLHLTARRFEITPILVDTVFKIQDKNIGYLFYTAFDGNKTNSLTDLSTAIARQKAAGINEFILDLRYNPGGYDFLAQRLTSLLAPPNEVSKQSVLIYEKFNDNYLASELRFDASVLSDNPGLKRIYVITTQNTASASEVLISGLKPYMPVTVIGKKTAGKYVGGSTFIPEDDDLKKWNLYLITFAYTNANKESVRGGISPDVEQNEFINYMLPLGDTRETLLAKTLEQIFGTTDITVKSASQHLPLLPVGTSYEKVQQRFITTSDTYNP